MIAASTINFDAALAAYGGYSGLARRLKLPLSTVHGWHQRGSIPMWRRKEIIAIARRDGHADTVVVPKKKNKRSKVRVRA